MKLRNLIGVVALMTLSMSAWASDEYEESRQVVKSFKIDSDTYVEVSNKYGNVEVNTWDKDSVKFTVDIRAKSDNYSDLDDMLEMIRIDFSASTGFVVVQTVWSDEVSVFKKQLYQIGQNLGTYEQVEVRYRIDIPSHLSLEINNEFGDIYVGDYNGDIEIDLSHGDFRARDLQRIKSLKAKYGKVKISEAASARVDLSYVSSAEFDKLDELVVKSTSSELEIEEVRTVQINSRHDEIVLDQVTEISGFTSLTNLEIGFLEDRMDITSKFGEVSIREVGQNAQLINLEGSNTDYQIGFSPFFSTGFVVDVSSNKQFSFSEEIHVDKELAGDKSTSFVGWVGTSTDQKVKVSSKGGYVKFDHQ